MVIIIAYTYDSCQNFHACNLLGTNTEEVIQERYFLSVSHMPFNIHIHDLLFQGTNGKQTEVMIGTIGISSKTNWDALDSVVRRIFKVSLDIS